MQQLIINGEGGLDARAAINANFAELYGAISLPSKLPNTAANTQLPVPANSFIPFIFIQQVTGNPNVTIGTQGGGNEILPAFDVPAGDPTPIAVNRTFADPAVLYFTVVGGSVNISVVILNSIL